MINLFVRAHYTWLQSKDRVFPEIGFIEVFIESNTM